MQLIEYRKILLILPKYPSLLKQLLEEWTGQIKWKIWEMWRDNSKWVGKNDMIARPTSPILGVIGPGKR
jgi:hypothetical protein